METKRWFELPKKRYTVDVYSLFPLLLFLQPSSTTILGRGSFHSADTRESWASFEELISFVSFQRALDAVAFEDPVTEEAGSKQQQPTDRHANNF